MRTALRFVVNPRTNSALHVQQQHGVVVELASLQRHAVEAWAQDHPDHPDHPEEGEVQQVDDSPIVIDFDVAPGDQEQRVHFQEEAPGVVELQLVAFDVPEVYGWSATLEFDPAQLSYVPNSFKPSGFIQGLIPLVDAQDGSIEVGGANFSKAVSSGDADLGVLSFETTDGFSGRAEVKLVRINARKLDATDAMDVQAFGVITTEAPERTSDFASTDGHDDEGEPTLSGEEALQHLNEENACPGCDLSGIQLMQAELEGADLNGADLSGANLFRATLSEAVLENANLHKANLMQVDLRKADLRGADLSESRLVGARLQGADLTDANLDDAKLTGASLSGTIWPDGRECARGSVSRCR